MSPFSHFLHELRMRYDIRQVELAETMGYEQSYISALEVGIKGPPPDEFIKRLIDVVQLTPAEQQELRAAAEASQRKLVLDPDTPQDIYWLVNDLREKVQQLSPMHVRMIRDVLCMRGPTAEERSDVPRRLKRRKKEEARM